METLGTKLKKLRQDKRISLEEIQKNTKVHIGVLEALEEDRFDNLSPVYVKGFLKIYCEYLEIDSQPFIQEYLSRVTSKLGIVIPEQSLFSPATSRVSHRFLEKKRLLVLSILVLFFTLVASLVFLRGHSKTVESSKVAVSPKTDSNLRLKSQIKTSLPIINPSPINPAKVAKESPYALRLVLRAKEDGWVKVFIDGKLIFQSVLRKGKSESWQAKDRIEFALGNAGAIEVEVNGKNLTTLGRKGQAIRSIVITKDGLVVGR